jgi:hypothetical protein
MGDIVPLVIVRVISRSLLGAGNKLAEFQRKLRS